MAITFDELLMKHGGQFGKYQLFISLLMAVGYVFLCITALSSVFIADNPSHQCKLPEEMLNFNCTKEEINNFTTPTVIDDEGNEIPDQCHLYIRNYKNVTEKDVCPLSTQHGNRTNEKEKCDSWTYDTSVYESTVVTEWNLVCDRAWMAKNTAGMYMGARIVGTFVWGWLADRFGRRAVFLLGIYIDGLSFVLSAFMPTYTSFIVCKIVQGFVSQGWMTVGFVLAIELVGPKYRGVSGAIIPLGWTIGFLVLPLVAYFLTDWKHLVFVIGGSQLAFSTLCLVVLPESPRWLLVNKQYEKAKKVIRKVATINGRDNSEISMTDVSLENESTSATPLDLLKTPGIRSVTLNLCFAWFVVSFVYFGIAMNISDLAGNIFINFVISGVFEVPADILGFVLLMYFGRVIPLSIAYFGCGICLLLILAVPTAAAWPIVILAMAGKFFTSVAFCQLYIVSCETYPTKLRGIGLSTNSTFARIGATVGVYAGLLVHVHRALPLVVFAIPSLLAGILVLVLPETFRQELMQTVQQSEEFIGSRSCGLCKNRRERSSGEDAEKFQYRPSEQESLSKTVQT